MWKMTISQEKVSNGQSGKIKYEVDVEVVGDKLESLSVIGEQLLATSLAPIKVKFEKVAADEVNG